jgi:hypothetical protein
MKVTDLRRKLAAALAAGGLLAPCAAQAANLDTNLIANPGFELVDFGTAGAYGSPVIQTWSNNGFAFSHDGTGGVPNYANNAGPPPGGGSWYFAPGYTNTGGVRHHSLASSISQTFDVSAGASGTLIASGQAAFKLSGYFSGYLTQLDRGVVQVDLLNSADVVLGTGQLSPPGVDPLLDWTQFVSGGLIPIGTAKVKVSAWGILAAGAASDGYMDNLDFQVSAQLPALSISVDRSTGVITLQNKTGSAQNISSYSITSAFESLTPATWLSIADNYDSGNPGPNQVDPAHAWTEESDPNGHGALTESELTTVGANLAASRNVNLGSSWIRSHQEDLAFTYISGGVQKTGVVSYVNGPGGQPLEEGDVNVDGAINAGDWAIVRGNQFADLSGKSLAEAYRLGDFTGDLQNNHDDFVAFKTLYDAANGAGAFAAMAATVPEPATIVLVGVAGLAVVSLARRRSA